MVDGVGWGHCDRDAYSHKRSDASKEVMVVDEVTVIWMRLHKGMLPKR